MNIANLKKIQASLVFCLAFFFMVSLCLLPAPARASASQSEQERTAMLVEGAKKEKKIVYYHTSPVDVGIKFLKRFQEKYPFIEFEVYRSGDESLMNKILAEFRANKYVFDVANTTASTEGLLESKGVFAKYLSPERKFYSKAGKDAEGYWTDIFLNLNTIGYNTKLVSSREAPRTWNDLLDPKWKGKMGMDTKAYTWFAHMLKVMGEKEGLAYMEKLSRQEIQFRTGRTLNTQMVAAGEVSIGITLYNHMVEDLKAKGAPIEWIAIEPVVPEIHPLAISSQAPHPNTARLFVDFMLSREGQEIMASTFRIPARVDVEAMIPALKKDINVLPYDFSILKDYNRYVKLYREVLMKR